MIYCSFYTSIQRDEDCARLMDIIDKIKEVLLAAEVLWGHTSTIKALSELGLASKVEMATNRTDTSFQMNHPN